VLSQTADADKIRELENDPNIVIHERRTEAFDTAFLTPVHIEPSFGAMRYRTTYVYEVVKPNKKSSSQDALSRRSTSSGRAPRTLDDTNEFISAFWVNGKPKCRKGYRYDFRRKMCRLIK
jgi:hypothetical protein